MTTNNQRAIETTTQEAKSLPCPFCGDTRPPIVEQMPDEFGDPIVWAECQYCGAQGPASDSEVMALARWNRRGREGREAMRKESRS